ncbi:MAG: toxin TcdB middle/N-terminal domain-containing protein [Candidatus Binatia bacterium]
MSRGAHVVGSIALAAGLLAATAIHGQSSPPPADKNATGDKPSAFTGLAQAPDANLFAGASSTSIPIDVPPGRKNLTPKLALTYSSSGGPSPYGYGWDLPLGKIQRSTKHGVLSCTDATYRNDFVLALPGATAECTLEANNVCKTRVEESFVRIEYLPGTNSWLARDKSGMRYVFGDVDVARTGSGTPSLFTAGSPCTYTHSWGLTNVTDPSGNTLTIGYQKISGVLHPTSIFYGGNGATGFNALFEVRFYWTALPSADRVVASLGGFAAQLTQRVSKIEVRYPAGSSNPADRIRYYTFNYDDDQYLFPVARPGRRSFLYFVTVYDKNDHALSRLDGYAVSTTLQYHQPDPTNADPARRQFGVATSPQGAVQPPVSTPGVKRWTDITDTHSIARRDIFDINGDGLPDLVDTVPCGASYPYWDVYPGTKDGSGRPVGFATARTAWSAPMLPGYWREHCIDALGTCFPLWHDPAPACTIRESGIDHTGATVTPYDTLDINGDGLPDFVYGDAPNWHVYFGYVISHGGGFGAQTDWLGAGGILRKSQFASSFMGWSDGVSLDTIELLDINGDGLPDRVLAGTSEGPATWAVFYNTGSGFGAATNFPAHVGPMRATANNIGLQFLGFTDINGDGLPDQILAWNGSGGAGYTGAWHVFYHKGLGIDDTDVPWTLPASGCWANGHQQNGLRQTLSAGGAEVMRDFFDLNGDGLPDVVDTCGYATGSNPYWRVYFNRGNGFATDHYNWRSVAGLIRHHDTGGAHPGGKTYWDTFDIDGDGIPDFVDFGDASATYVYHNQDGAWAAAGAGVVENRPTGAPQPKRADLLEVMENGLGATTTLEYRPSTQWDNTGGDGITDLPFNLWTVTRIERDDGMCDASGANCLGVAGAAHSVATTYRYQDGRYDPTDREFRGFGTVEARDPDPGLPLLHQAQFTFFRQGAALAGKVHTTITTSVSGDTPTAWLVVGSNTWQCVDANSLNALDCPVSFTSQESRVIVRLTKVERTDVGASSYHTAVTQNLAFDAYGNITHANRGGDNTTPLHTYTDYAYNTIAYIVDKPTHVLVKDNDITPLEEKWFAYDGLGLGSLNKGNVTAVYSWLGQVVDNDPNLPRGGSCPATPAGATGTGCVSTLMDYDSYGNITTVTDAKGGVTTTTYDTTTRIYPYTVRQPTVVKPAAEPSVTLEVATQYDPACGKLRSQTITYLAGADPTAQPKTQYDYDSFCRLTKVALPDETLSVPHLWYTYYLGNPYWVNFFTGQVVPQHATDIWIEEDVGAPARAHRDELYDALGRPLQAQRTGVVDGNTTVIVEGTNRYDVRGNVTATVTPFTATYRYDNGAVVFAPPATGAPTTSMTYDALGRVTQVTNPDSSSRTSDYSIAWQTTTHDECYNAARCIGGKTIEVGDAFGRVIEKDSYEEGASTRKAGTQYAYDGLGRLVTTTQWGGTSWNHATDIAVTYDALGRKIKMWDPDSGWWKYGYDTVGNLIYQEDPKISQHVQFCYDAINRVTKKQYFTNDSYGAGWCSYTVGTQISSFYDDAAVAYSVGRLTTVTDLSGSTLYKQYDVRGRARRIDKQLAVNGRVTTATTLYQYDRAGHVTQITYPDTPPETVVYGFNAEGNVVSLKNTAATPTWYLSNLTYDVFGRPRVITHGNGTTDSRTYGTAATNFRLGTIETKQGNGTTHLKLRYAAYTPTGLLTQLTDLLNSTGQRSNSAAFTYDALGRLTQASGVNLPAPNTYGFDVLGNLTVKEGATLGYSATRPHTVTTLNGSSAALASDPNGNRLGKPNHTYSYTPDDRVQTIAVTGQPSVTEYYDHSGRQVARQVGSNWTRYYSELAEEGPDNYLTKHYFAGGVRIASSRVYAPQLAGLPGAPAILVAQAPAGQAAVVVLLRTDVQRGVLLAVGILGTGLLFAPWRRKRVVGIAIRHGHVVGIIVVWTVATLPLPLLLRPAQAQATPALYHYHLDHLGSTQVITNSLGGEVEQIRYKPYGEIRYRSTTTNNRYQFTGYETETTSNLEYAGARFYDPVLGQFLSHDPAREYASPYAYVHGDPINGTDPSGACEAICMFVVTLVSYAAIGAAVSASINMVVAGATGGDVSAAVQSGAMTGAIGVGMGVVAGGVGIGMAKLAATLPESVGVAKAAAALGEVAARSALSVTMANAAGQTASAAGAPGWAVTLSSVVAGYAGSYLYDANFIDPSGNLAAIEGKGNFAPTSNTATHATTEGLARSAGYLPEQAKAIADANLNEDVRVSIWSNQSHFSLGARQALKKFSNEAVPLSGIERLKNVGAATHYIQDSLTLGHMVPGTQLLAGPLGAPFRFLIHQTFGGEVFLRESWRTETLQFLTQMRNAAAA